MVAINTSSPSIFKTVTVPNPVVALPVSFHEANQELTSVFTESLELS